MDACFARPQPEQATPPNAPCWSGASIDPRGAAPPLLGCLRCCAPRCSSLLAFEQGEVARSSLPVLPSPGVLARWPLEGKRLAQHSMHPHQRVPRLCSDAKTVPVRKDGPGDADGVCASTTPGASTAADLAAKAATWEDSLALIEIHPGAHCEVRPVEGTCHWGKQRLTIKSPTRARAVDTAYGRWLCTVQGQRCLVHRLEATVLEEATAE